MSESGSGRFVAKQRLPYLGLLGMVVFGLAFAGVGGRALATSAPMDIPPLSWADKLLGFAIASPTARAWMFFLFGGTLVLLALTAIPFRETILVVDGDGVGSISDAGPGRLTWTEIARVRAEGDMIEVVGAGGRRIAVSARETNRKAADILAAIHARKPSLAGPRGA